MNAVHKPASIEQRLEPLVRGWSAAPNGPAQIVASMLARQLGTEPQDFALAQDTLAFKLDLSRIRFRGMHEAHCILAGGERPETAVWVRLAAGARGLGRIVVVCAVNPTLADRLRLLTADQRCVVLGIEQIRCGCLVG